MLLVGLAAHEEAAVAEDERRADDAGDQLAQARLEVLARREAGQVRKDEAVLRLTPRRGAGVVEVLQPAIGIGHRVTVDQFNDVETLSSRIIRHVPPRLVVRS